MLMNSFVIKDLDYLQTISRHKEEYSLSKSFGSKKFQVVTFV
jgi:hypothetical protein